MTKQKPEEVITQQILSSFTENTVPWKPDYKVNGPSILTPVRNNGMFYRGINVLILTCMSLKHGYTSPYFITYKQCQEEGGNLKGQKGVRIIKYGTMEVDAKSPGDDPKSIPYLRSYVVFNVSQASGLPDDFIEKRTVEEKCTHSLHELVEACGVSLYHGSDMGAYFPEFDQIRLPNLSSYVDEHAYAATLAHELIHSTGHKSRLDRDLNQDDIEIRSFEELVAELGSTFLLNRMNIPTRLEDRVIPYISGWVKNMGSNAKYILKASAQAQKAVDYIFESLSGSHTTGTVQNVSEHPFVKLRPETVIPITEPFPQSVTIKAARG